MRVPTVLLPLALACLTNVHAGTLNRSRSNSLGTSERPLTTGFPSDERFIDTALLHILFSISALNSLSIGAAYLFIRSRFRPITSPISLRTVCRTYVDPFDPITSNDEGVSTTLFGALCDLLNSPPLPSTRRNRQGPTSKVERGNLSSFPAKIQRAVADIIRSIERNGDDPFRTWALSIDYLHNIADVTRNGGEGPDFATLHAHLITAMLSFPDFPSKNTYMFKLSALQGYLQWIFLDSSRGALLHNSLCNILIAPDTPKQAPENILRIRYLCTSDPTIDIVKDIIMDLIDSTFDPEETEFPDMEGIIHKYNHDLPAGRLLRYVIHGNSKANLHAPFSANDISTSIIDVIEQRKKAHKRLLKSKGKKRRTIMRNRPLPTRGPSFLRNKARLEEVPFPSE